MCDRNRASTAGSTPGLSASPRDREGVAKDACRTAGLGGHAGPVGATGPWDQGTMEEQEGRMLLLAKWGQGLRISLGGCSVLAELHGASGYCCRQHEIKGHLQVG